MVDNALMEYFVEFTFPPGLDKDEAISSTKSFAYSRLKLDIQEEIVNRDENQEFKPLSNILCNPTLFKLAEAYPLPLSYDAIGIWWVQNELRLSPDYGYMPRPLVDTHGGYAGWVYKAENNDTIGWFIGLVEDVNKQKMHELIDSGKPNPQLFFELFENNQYRFIEGMILLEGKLDECESVLSELRNVKADYDRDYLGQIVHGRRFSYDSKFFVEKAKEVLKNNPHLKQKFLVPEIGRSLRAFQMDIRNEGYKNFLDFKAKVLKK